MVSNIGVSGVSRVRGAEPGVRMRDSHRFARVAALAYGFAGLVLPLVGWVVGITLVWMSNRWTTRQKLISAIVPTMLLTLTVAAVAGASAAQNALVVIPSAYDLAWGGLSAVAVITTSLGMWLTHAMRK